MYINLVLFYSTILETLFDKQKKEKESKAVPSTTTFVPETTTISFSFKNVQNSNSLLFRAIQPHIRNTPTERPVVFQSVSTSSSKTSVSENSPEVKTQTPLHFNHIPTTTWGFSFFQHIPQPIGEHSFDGHNPKITATTPMSLIKTTEQVTTSSPVLVLSTTPKTKKTTTKTTKPKKKMRQPKIVREALKEYVDAMTEYNEVLTEFRMMQRLM